MHPVQFGTVWTNIFISKPLHLRKFPEGPYRSNKSNSASISQHPSWPIWTCSNRFDWDVTEFNWTRPCQKFHAWGNINLYITLCQISWKATWIWKEYTWLCAWPLLKVMVRSDTRYIFSIGKLWIKFHEPF